MVRNLPSNQGAENSRFLLKITFSRICIHVTQMHDDACLLPLASYSQHELRPPQGTVPARRDCSMGAEEAEGRRCGDGRGDPIPAPGLPRLRKQQFIQPKYYHANCGIAHPMEHAHTSPHSAPPIEPADPPLIPARPGPARMAARRAGSWPTTASSAPTASATAAAAPPGPIRPGTQPPPPQGAHTRAPTHIILVDFQ